MKLWLNKIIRFPEGCADFKLGDEKRDEGNWPAAVAAYRRGLRWHAGSAPHWVQLGHVLKEAGRLQDAVKAYERAQRLLPDDADLPVHQGHLWRLLGDEDRAQVAYLRALSAGSRDEHAMHALRDRPERHAATERVVARLTGKPAPANAPDAQARRLVEIVLSNIARDAPGAPSS